MIVTTASRSSERCTCLAAIVLNEATVVIGLLRSKQGAWRYVRFDNAHQQCDVVFRHRIADMYLNDFCRLFVYMEFFKPFSAERLA